MAEFPHRKNPDGSYDSICLECFANAASSDVEEELAALEAKHVCVHPVVRQSEPILVENSSDPRS